MASKSFSTIPYEELVTAYQTALENSDAKWRAAKNNAASGEYGIASSLCVISIEDLVKAILLCLDNQGFEFRRVRGMNVIFKNHQVRHYIAYWLFAMSWAMHEFIAFLKKAMENPKWALALAEEMKQENFVDRKMKFYLLRQLSMLKNELNWFSRIDTVRQDGFYADYKDALKNPLTISKEQYEDVSIKLSFVRTIGRSFITQMETKDKAIAGLLEKTRIEFKSKDHYSIIAGALEQLRAHKNGPFDMFKKSAGIEQSS